MAFHVPRISSFFRSLFLSQYSSSISFTRRDQAWWRWRSVLLVRTYIFLIIGVQNRHFVQNKIKKNKKIKSDMVRYGQMRSDVVICGHSCNLRWPTVNLKKKLGGFFFFENLLKITEIYQKMQKNKLNGRNGIYVKLRKFM